MDPRDRAANTPDHASGDAVPDWLTEESVAEGAAAGGATTDATAQRTPVPAPAPAPPASGAASAAPSAQPSDGTWLASTSGLVPNDPAANRSASVPPDADFTGTRVYPRTQPAAAAPDDWGWQNADDPPPAAPISRVTPRTATPLPPPPTGGGQPDDWYGRAVVDPAVLDSPAPPGGRGAKGAAAYGYADWETERRRGFPWRRLLVAFVLGLLLTAFVAGGAIYAYERQYDDRILPNVHVGTVDVSGLTVDEAKQKVSQAYAGLGQGTVHVTLQGAAAGTPTSTDIPYSSFGRQADVDGMVNAAFGVGRSTAIIDRLLGELRVVTRGATIEPRVVLDGTKLAAQVHAVAQEAEWDKVDANAVVTQTGYSTTPSKTGQSVDEGSGTADVVNQLTAVDAPSDVAITLVATPIPPAVSDTSAQLAAKQAQLMDNDVVLSDGTDTWTIPAAVVHDWLSFTIINNRARISIDTQAVLNQVKPLATQINRPVVNATLKMQGTKIVFGTPSQGGRTLDPSKTTTAIVNALRNRAQGTLAPDAPIAPVLQLVEPTLTTEQAKADIPLMKPISSWQTNYQPAAHNGFGANIKIPTAKINGYVVAPHDTFSFWKAVGPVTKELGYKPGGAIIDGHTEPTGAIGGGICSCSTTLFNAALRAGFQMGDRLNHYYYINRYPLGLDATVFISAGGQAQDMSWTNDTDYPVAIQGINGNGFVKFVLYSVPNGRTTTFTQPTVKNYTKATTVTKVDKSIPKGSRSQIEYATDGEDVWVTRTVKDKTGAVIHKETYFSHYATITGVILINP
jgi:vancomycin resistance protein YoaR